MADFCYQCTAELFGKEVADKNDFVGIIPEYEVRQGYRVPVLCEGCGNALVDHRGKCHAKDCLKQHGEPNGN